MFPVASTALRCVRLLGVYLTCEAEKANEIIGVTTTPVRRLRRAEHVRPRRRGRGWGCLGGQVLPNCGRRLRESLPASGPVEVIWRVGTELDRDESAVREAEKQLRGRRCLPIQLLRSVRTAPRSRGPTGPVGADAAAP